MGFWNSLFGGDKSEGESGAATAKSSSSPLAIDDAPGAHAKSGGPSPNAAAISANATARTPPTPPPTASKYGIDKANDLLSSLRVHDNPDFAVRIIRKTLESAGVSVPDLIVDAEKREAELREDVAKRKATIADYEDKIVAERREIEKLEAALKLTGETRGYLELAEENRTQMRPAFNVGARAAAPNVPPTPPMSLPVPSIPATAATGAHRAASLDESRPTVPGDTQGKSALPPSPLPSTPPVPSTPPKPREVS